MSMPRLQSGKIYWSRNRKTMVRVFLNTPVDANHPFQSACMWDRHGNIIGNRGFTFTVDGYRFWGRGMDDTDLIEEVNGTNPVWGIDTAKPVANNPRLLAARRRLCQSRGS